MSLLAEDPDNYGNAVALLAVHSAISLVDAILIGCTGRRCNMQNHGGAITELKKLCGQRRIDTEGIGHFDWLIKKKTPFSYGDQRLDPDKDISNARLKADRFTTWAYKHFPEIAKAGQ